MFSKDKSQLSKKKNELVSFNRNYYLNTCQMETFCFKCESIRPSWAHHCSSCGRCVRRMDHHCPFLGNCVGEFNIRYFIQFLIYAGISLISNFIIVIVLSILYKQDEEMLFGFMIFISLVAIFYGIAVFFFGIYHLWLASMNITTLEWEYLSKENNPFDLKSKKQNLKQVIFSG